ncbi:CPBP family intramembrane metalloprotease [Modestobacter sp. I12A-02628]|uniref:CPBP family intramembrane metalloprotease n=1 Tax=Goekera deserti TaxID=2497753 RepID=A0A7K3WAB5_9ACTN|nr:CPBP family intramembrane glutamic endopeptidase [Goekera deserti]MPQ99256.1 CPBP family intramembrane metalloprotease [Goekera deserti]NDI47591.1 CPBP family intramembrane metalloprotease [Goekera deserti]NEL53402.1 CPBP family intramembrane metalloprotease [Goekera deserti]
MTGLPDQLDDFGAAAFAAVVIAGYLVVGEPFVGQALHRRFEAHLRVDPAARRSFYRRLLLLEWGLAALVAVVWLAAADVDAAQLGLAWPHSAPGPLTVLAVAAVLVLLVLSVRSLRAGVLLEDPGPGAATDAVPTAPVTVAELTGHRAAGGRHAGPPAEPPAAAVLALLPRSPAERRLFALVGVTAGVCEEWLYRGFFLAVVAALAPSAPAGVLVLLAAVAFGAAHAYQGLAGVLTTGVLGGVLAALYLQTGSLLLPVLLHAAIDLRFLLVPASRLPAARVQPAS